MLQEEFEKRTGIYPSMDAYTVINDFYNSYDGDKDQFCTAFTKNTDNLAVRIQGMLNQSIFTREKIYLEEKVSLEKEIQALRKQIDKLTLELMREQEWKPYEDPHNVSQDDYEKLSNALGTMAWSDTDVKDYLHQCFGFDQTMVTVFHTVPKTEINRHRQIRNCGTYERPPIYNATDWHYARFDSGMMSWELYNDELLPFYH